MIIGQTNPIAGLTEIGFSDYEARAYLELLHSSPVTAYELAKNSGIPSSKIYETCARLVERGAALPLEEAGRTRYTPLAPHEFMASQRLLMEDRLNRLETLLHDQGDRQRLSYIWNISDLETLIEQLRLLIDNARHEIILSGWHQDISPVSAELLALELSGVRVAILLFGSESLWAEPPPNIRVYHHPIEDTLYQERGGRGLTVVADGTRSLMATISAQGLVEGAWSLNHGFVLLAEDYVKHDIYLMKIITRMGDQLAETFGPGYQLLRNVFNDQDTANAEEEIK